MMTKIAILSHWHTASSLIARQLQLCGMEVGNKNTFWNEDCEAQCEHGILNRIGDQLWRGDIFYDEGFSRITEILDSYIKEALVKHWNCFGVKVTHALQEPCFIPFLNAFDLLWGRDIVYIITTRSIEAIIDSTNDEEWGPNKVRASIDSTYYNIGLLSYMRNVFILKYPWSWIDGRIEFLMNYLGLMWNTKAKDLFDSNRAKSVDNTWM